MDQNLPRVLTATVTAIANSLDASGELPPAARKELLECIEELSIREHPSAGYLRRSRLGLLCAARTMRKIDGFPELRWKSAQIWNHSLSALSGQYELKALETAVKTFHTDIINHFEFGDTAYAAVYGAMACFAAASIVLYDIDWEIAAAADISVPPDDWSPWFFSSISAAESAVWEEKGGLIERRRFWLWFAGTAVPLAWNVNVPLKSVQ